MTLPDVTRQQLAAIRDRLDGDPCIRILASHGALIPYGDADNLGEDGLAWLTACLGLRRYKTCRGVELVPAGMKVI